MAVKRTELRGVFRARDGAGNWHTVVVFQQIVDARTAKNPNAEMLGMKVLRTADGRPVTQMGKGLYAIVDRPMIRLASYDPGAP